MSESKQSDGIEVDSKRDHIGQQDVSTQGDQDSLQSDQGTLMKKGLAGDQRTEKGSDDKETQVALDSQTPSERSGET